MENEIVTKNRNIFGRLNITIPMPVKESMMDWMNKSGMGRAEFFRVALMMGAIQLANQVQAKEQNEGFNSREGK
jgi:hypothetical protein